MCTDIREEIAKLIHDNFDKPTAMGDANWRDFPKSLRPRFYGRADQIIALINQWLEEQGAVKHKLGVYGTSITQFEPLRIS